MCVVVILLHTLSCAPLSSPSSASVLCAPVVLLLHHLFFFILLPLKAFAYFLSLTALFFFFLLVSSLLLSSLLFSYFLFSSSLLSLFLFSSLLSLCFGQRPVKPTLAPAMDISIPSNFERFLFHLLNNDPVALRRAMDAYATTGQLHLGSDHARLLRQVLKKKNKK